MPELIDTHAHLDFPEFIDSIPETLERAQAAGVGTIITIGIDIPTSKIAAGLAERYDRVYAAAGIHPHDAMPLDDGPLSELEELAGRGRVLAVGEIGLDYYRDRKPRALQKECMKQQIELGCRIKKPIVFHIREAWDDFFEIVSHFAPSMEPSVMHCFSGDWEKAERCLDMGFYLSIPGVVTFPKALDLHEVVRRAPLDRLILETDSPYLAPVPYRGKTNEPAFVRHTAEKVAELRNEPLESIAENTTRNARAVFRI